MLEKGHSPTTPPSAAFVTKNNHLSGHQHSIRAAARGGRAGVGRISWNIGGMVQHSAGGIIPTSRYPFHQVNKALYAFPAYAGRHSPFYNLAEEGVDHSVATLLGLVLPTQTGIGARRWTTSSTIHKCSWRHETSSVPSHPTLLPFPHTPYPHTFPQFSHCIYHYLNQFFSSRLGLRVHFCQHLRKLCHHGLENTGGKGNARGWFAGGRVSAWTFT